jgi:signal transduction histidine kinase
MAIRARLVLSYLLTTLVAMSLLAGYNLLSFREYAFATMHTELAGRGDALVSSIADALASRDRDAVRLAVEHATGIPNYTVRVFDREGDLVASSDRSDSDEPKNWRIVPGVSEALESRTSRGRSPSVIEGTEDRLFDARPITRGGEVLGALRVSMSLASVEREIARSLSMSLALIVVTFLLCLAVGLRFAHGISAPLRTMRSYARRLGGGSFGEPLAIDRGDEIGELAEELHAMSQRLARLDDERRSFLANAAHEMRTPVSNVLVTLEALDSGAQNDPLLRAQFLHSSLEETRRLAHLIKELLDLGRIDAGVVQLETQLVPLRALLDRAASAIGPRMGVRGIEVELDVPDSWLEVRADSERLLQAVMNVLDNALKFSPDGEKVRIAGYADEEDVCVEVHDAGPGIAQADLVHLFEPFYTGDLSRTRGGAGLGLAMARRIVHAHGGTITAASPETGGAVFTIRLFRAVARNGSLA